MNYLVRYPIAIPELEGWANAIVQIKPDIDVEAVTFMMKGFATDDIPWDNNKGIQNIFIGLKYVQKQSNGSFRIIAPHAW